MGAVRSSAKTVSEIARERGLTRQNCQRLVNALQREKFVELQQNPKDRRARLVALTAKGSSSLVALTERNRTWADALARSFTAAELDELGAALRRLSDGIQRLRKQAAG